MRQDIRTTLAQHRAALENLVQFEGSYIAKLGEAKREQIRSVMDEYAILTQHVQHRKKVDLTGLRAAIASLEELRERPDRLAACHSLARYNEALAALEAATKALKEEAGYALAPSDAVRFGLARAVLNYT